MMKIFVYGTLMQGFPNNRLLEYSKFISETTITYNGKMISCGGFPAIIDGEKENVIHGEVFEIDENTLSNLDHLEGHPNWYRRVKVKTSDGQDVEFYAQRENEYSVHYNVLSGSWREYCNNQKNSFKHYVKPDSKHETLLNNDIDDCTTIPFNPDDIPDPSEDAIMEIENAIENDLDEEDEGDEPCERIAENPDEYYNTKDMADPVFSAQEPILTDSKDEAEELVRILNRHGFEIKSGADPYSLTKGKIKIIITAES